MHCAQRAADLTQQLLTFGRKQEARITTVDLCAVAAKTTNMISSVLDERIRLDVRLCEEPWPILADEAAIEQVVINLLLNAKDAMPTGGTLTLAVEKTVFDDDYLGRTPCATQGPHMTLRVDDTGTGMTEAVQSRIFEPFFTTKEVGQGTGLGLATVYGAVTQSGGHLTVTSELDHGTSIRAAFPCRAAANSATSDVAIAAGHSANGLDESLRNAAIQAAAREQLPETPGT